LGKQTIAKNRKKSASGQEGDPFKTRWAREDEDVRLMLRFQAGDVSAFDKLVDRNTHKVHALVYRFLGDPDQVEDLTQEVFLRIYRTAQRYQPKAKFSTWLYRIVANLSFNVLRSRKRAHTVPLESGGPDDNESYSWEIADETGQAPQDPMDNEELGQVIAQAVERLPENQKVAIILNKFENKSYEEISEVLDISTMAVKSLLSRARTNLRETLRKYVSREEVF
jgi:RNA polymerase sigma-70 factor (ECF subfamily)